MSPSAAFLKWPMCAALLGLMLVCSTMTLPPGCGLVLVPREVALEVAAAVEEDVEIASAGDVDVANAVDSGERGREGFRDLARRHFGLARQIERSRKRGVSEARLRWPLVNDDVEVDVEVPRAPPRGAPPRVAGEDSAWALGL